MCFGSKDHMLIASDYRNGIKCTETTNVDLGL